MPTYVFECIPCKMVISQVRSVAQRDDVMRCTKCEAAMFRRLDFQGSHFKGEGFYSTDKRGKAK